MRHRSLIDTLQPKNWDLPGMKNPSIMGKNQPSRKNDAISGTEPYYLTACSNRNTGFEVRVTKTANTPLTASLRSTAFCPCRLVAPLSSFRPASNDIQSSPSQSIA